MRRSKLPLLLDNTGLHSFEFWLRTVTPDRGCPLLSVTFPVTSFWAGYANPRLAISKPIASILIFFIMAFSLKNSSATLL
jgi:hypothetical protein